MSDLKLDWSDIVRALSLRDYIEVWHIMSLNLDLMLNSKARKTWGFFPHL